MTRTLPIPDEISFVNDLAVDNLSKTFLLLDSRAGLIYVLDEEGRTLRKIGRPGQGPGEFSHPISIQVLPGNLFATVDSGAQKIIFFSIDGTYVKERKLSGIPLGRMLLLEEQALLVTHQKSAGGLYVSKKDAIRPFFSVIDTEGSVIKSSEDQVIADSFVNATRGDVIPLLVGQDLFIIHTIENKIERYRNLSKMREGTLPLAFEPVEPTAEVQDQDGYKVVVPKIDTLVTDAVLLKSNPLLLMPMGPTHSGEILSYKIQIIDGESLSAGKEIRLDGSFLALDKISDQELILLAYDDGEFSLVILNHPF